MVHIQTYTYILFIDMLIELKSLHQAQHTASMRQHNINPSYCSYIRYLLSNIPLFIAMLSLDHDMGCQNRSEGKFYTQLFSKTTIHKPHNNAC